MVLYLESLFFVVVVIKIGYVARRKEGFLSNSWKTKLEVPVHITAAMQTSLVEVFSFSGGIIPQVLLGSSSLCSCEPRSRYAMLII